MTMKTVFNIGLDGLPSGLGAGRTVEVVRGGDPMVVRVLGTRIGMARPLAAAVRVERGHEA